MPRQGPTRYRKKRATITTVSTMSERIATAWEGRKFSKGKPKPSTLVATVVTRKTVAHPSRRFPETNPPTVTSPEKIPTRLETTWSSVYRASPELIADHPFEEDEACGGSAKLPRKPLRPCETKRCSTQMRPLAMRHARDSKQSLSAPANRTAGYQQRNGLRALPAMPI